MSNTEHMRRLMLLLESNSLDDEDEEDAATPEGSALLELQRMLKPAIPGLGKVRRISVHPRNDQWTSYTYDSPGPIGGDAMEPELAMDMHLGSPDHITIRPRWEKNAGGFHEHQHTGLDDGENERVFRAWLEEATGLPFGTGEILEGDLDTDGHNIVYSYQGPAAKALAAAGRIISGWARMHGRDLPATGRQQYTAWSRNG